MTNVIRRLNVALLVVTILLGTSLTGAVLQQAGAQDAPRPATCEATITMISSCRDGLTASFSPQPYLLCKTGSGSETNWCCEYQARSNICHNQYAAFYAGYVANYTNAYVTPLTCGGVVHGQCS